MLYDADLVATAVVDRVTQLDDCSVNDLRELAVGYKLHEAEDYWRNLSRRGFLGRLAAVIIWTRDERWREAPLKRLVRFRTLDVSRRVPSDSWIVVNQADDLAEVDAPPEVNDLAAADARPEVAGATLASGHGPSVANMLAIAGMLLLGLIGLVVLVVVLLMWGV